MKLSLRLPILALTLFVGLQIFSPARPWTAADGRKMEADFVSSDGTTVNLVRAGKKFTLALDKLSAEDQQWVKDQAAAKPTTPAAAPAAPATAPKEVSGEYAALITGDWALSTFKNLPFALYAAKELDAAKTYPLVLTLHGKSDNNENGKQVGGWMKSFTKKERYDKNPCIVVAPLCYQPFGGTGGGWSDKPGTEAIALVESLVKKLPLVDKNRIYVMGHSMGGFGTCNLINLEPRLFAAGVPISGYGMVSQAGNLKKVPIWMFHAADDDVVKVGGARDLAKALDSAKNFKYTEMPTGGHGIPDKVCEDAALHEWLFQQARK